MSKTTVAIIGSNGQLGSDLAKIFADKYQTVCLTHKDIEILDPKSIATAFKKTKPDIIVNTAAYTRVDEAEMYPEKAFAVNAIGTKNLVDYCSLHNIVFVLYSTDYVFGQDAKRRTPYTEDDTPGPVNTYGISKLSGEEYVKSNLGKYFIIRTTGLFGVAGSSGKGYNFVELMLKLSKEQTIVSVVDDQVSSPTYTRQLAIQTLLLLKTKKYGLYHITSKGGCSWYEFAKEVFTLTNVHVNVKRVTKKTWKTPATRPHYSVLKNKKVEDLTISIMTSWKKALKEYLQEKNYI